VDTERDPVLFRPEKAGLRCSHSPDFAAIPGPHLLGYASPQVRIARFRSQKVAALVAYLAFHHASDALTGRTGCLMWSDAPWDALEEATRLWQDPLPQRRRA
jgi:hypothetical protein